MQHLEKEKRVNYFHYHLKKVEVNITLLLIKFMSQMNPYFNTNTINILYHKNILENEFD